MASADLRFMVLSLSKIRILLLAGALTLAAPWAFPAPPESHAEALAALAGEDTTVRLEAIVWLANYGGLAHAGLLHEPLRDESANTRDYAQHGLQGPWSRARAAALRKPIVRVPPA